MSAWSKTPPNHKDWMNANNDGHWWVKFMVSEREEDVDEDGNPIWWPEVWQSEVVQITDAITNGLLKSGRLTTQGNILKRFYLDDPEATEGLYWQPVAPPLDDVEDQRPEVD